MWLALALIATLLSIWLKVATALSEIVVGTIAQLVIGVAAGAILLAADDSAISSCRRRRYRAHLPRRCRA